MAENKIGKYDIYSKESLGTIKEVQGELLSTLEIMKLLADSGVKLQESLKKPQGLEDTAKATEKVVQNNNRLVETAKQLEAQQNKLIAAQARETASRTQANKEIFRTNQATAENNKIAKLQAVLADENAGKLEKLRAANGLLRIQKEKLKETDENYVETIAKLNEEMDKNQAEIAATHNAEQKRTAGIGEYKKQIGELIQGLQSGEVSAKDFGKGVLDAGKNMAKAFISNPIVLLASALIGLVAAFKRTQAGANAFAKVGAYMKGALSGIIGVVNSLVGSFSTVKETITGVFNDPLGALKEFGQALLDNIVNRFKGIIDLGSAVGQMFKSLWDKDLKGVKDAAKDAGQAFIQMGTGLDKEQQGKIADAIGGVTEKINESAKAMMNLEAQRQKNRISARQMEQSLAKLQGEEELLTAIADDATKSFKEREAAAEAARLKREEASKMEIALAKQNKSILDTEIKIRRSNGEAIDDLLDQQKDANIALIEAEKNYTNAVRENEKQRSELKSDRLEKDLDILIDGFDRQKTVNEMQINNDKLAIEERQKLLNQTVEMGRNSFEEQKKTIEDFVGSKINFDELMAESDAKVLNEKIRALGLSEIYEGRILEVLNERKQAEADFAEAQQTLDAEEIERKRENLELFYREQVIAQKESMGLFSANAEEREKQEAELAAKLLELQRAQLTAVLSDTNATKAEQIDAREQLWEIEQQLHNQKMGNLEAESEKRKAITAQSIELAGQAFDVIGQFQDVAMSRLEARHERELASTEEGSEARIKAEAKYDVEKRKLQRKQAVLEKAQGLFNVGVNTAQAIMSALVEFPGPAGLVFSAIFGAMGAAQAAAILAKPLPAFKDGGIVGSDTWARVSEEGAELVRLPSGGTMLTPENESIMRLPRGAEVIPHDETMRLLAREAYVSANIEMGETNRILNKIHDKPSENVVNGVRYVNKKGLKGVYY